MDNKKLNTILSGIMISCLGIVAIAMGVPVGLAIIGCLLLVTVISIFNPRKEICMSCVGSGRVLTGINMDTDLPTHEKCKKCSGKGVYKKCF